MGLCVMTCVPVAAPLMSWQSVACALHLLRVWVHKRAAEEAPHMGEPLTLQPVIDAMNRSQ